MNIHNSIAPAPTRASRSATECPGCVGPTSPPHTLYINQGESIAWFSTAPPSTAVIFLLNPSTTGDCQLKYARQSLSCYRTKTRVSATIFSDLLTVTTRTEVDIEMSLRFRELAVWALIALAVVARAHEDAEMGEDEEEFELGPEESRNIRPRAYNQPLGGFIPNSLPSGFRAPDDEDVGGGIPTQHPSVLRPQLQQQQQPGALDPEQFLSLVPLRPRPQHQALYQQQQQAPPPTLQPVRQAHRKEPLRRPIQQQEELREELEEEEKEEPDRLTLLLQNSKFDCSKRSTGYYADEELACEVFHYCQENVKHSWICPEGFTFHQVHLICMPPSGDNICQKSSKYHFVNDYLYKPLNAEEHERKPNVTLRYSDRYYPAEVYHDDRYEDEEEDAEEQEPPRRARPQQQQQQQQQVFHSPSEVNIPLLQRRPAVSFAPARQHLQQQQPQPQQQYQNSNDFEYQ